MNSSGTYEKSPPPHISWQAWIVLITLGAAFLYLWIVPLVRPRGDFLWGYYRLKDIYIGIPVGLAFLSILTVFAVPRRLTRPLALRLASVSISLLIALFVCDAVYALVVNGAWQANFWLDQGHIDRRYSIADDELGFVRKPGVSWRGFVPEVNRTVEYLTDENGFRNPAEINHADIVFVGDSFTESATTEQNDTFVRQVGALSRLSVVNLGRGAYGPQQELIVLRRYGLAYRPRIVVWQIFEGNDLNDAQVFAGWKDNPQQESISFKDRYFENSLLGQSIPRIRRPQFSSPLGKLRHSDGTETQMSLRYEYDPEAPRKNPLGFAETAKAIEEGYRLCQSHGVELLVVFVPTMARVMEPYLTFDRPEHRTRYLSNDVGEKDFSERIAELCAKLGCSFIDAFTALQKAAAIDTRGLYVPEDEHLDIRGHKVVAETIFGWMRSKVSESSS